MNAQRYRPFVGIDENSNTDPETDIPDAYRQTLRMMNGTASPLTTLKSVVHALEKAEPAPVFYRDANGEYAEISNNVAVVNPDWLANPDECPESDPVWNVPTRSYEVVNPVDVWGPLMATTRSILSDRREKGTFRDPELFGMARENRNGGEVHLDVFFPSYSVDFGDEDDDTSRDRFVMGITTGKDYFRNQTLYATPIAFDANTGGVMRHLDETNRRRHRKAKDDARGDSARETAGWYASMINRLDSVSKTLYHVIADARNYTIDFAAVPYGPVDMYVANGVPESVAENAAEALPDSPRATENTTASAWDMYRALTTALSDGFTSKTDGQAIRGHIQAANQLLEKPNVAEKTALNATRRELADESPEILKEHHDSLMKRDESISDGVEQYGTIRERLRDMLADGNADGDREGTNANDAPDREDAETDKEPETDGGQPGVSA